MMKIKMLAAATLSFAFASTAMAKQDTLVMRINKKTGELSMAKVDRRLKPGTAVANLNFAKVAAKSEKAKTTYTANNELKSSTSRSASLYFPGAGYGGYGAFGPSYGGYGYSMTRASYSRQIYSSYGGGYYGNGGYTQPWISNGYYPNYGGLGYQPYGYAEDENYAYGYCGNGGYAGLGDGYGYDGYGYDQNY